MVAKITILLGALAAVSSVNATAVTGLVVDIAGGLGVGICTALVTFDDSPSNVELHGCSASSDGITVNSSKGPVTVKCDVNSQGGGANQCATQRVVCRSGCCATVNLQGSEASCTIPDMCTSGDCTICAESIGSNLPVNLVC
jgi:hypothetical protein